MATKRPSAPMIGLLLVLLMFGSIGAADAAGLTVRKVKQIAAQVIAKKAPTLTVARARSADRARTADQLAGRAPATYLDRAVGGFAPSVPLSAGVRTQVIAPITITVPPGVGFVHATGQIGYNGPANSLTVTWVGADSEACADGVGLGYDRRTFGGVDGSSRDLAVQDILLPVTPGVHTFQLCGYLTQAGTALQSSLTVETVAGNAAGGTSAPRTGAAPRGDILGR
ncbi:hypothetical protein [Nocardioides sp. GXZ039]|uniref:hypothetical protein n=1 Tax=Nocardioides sp. GXZ039 TaxID=3136018 RepID=UPI0030F36FB5